MLPPNAIAPIRHYRLLANRSRQKRIERAKALLLPGDTQVPAEPEETRSSHSPFSEAKLQRWTCPYCGERALVRVEAVPALAGAPPGSPE